MKNRQLSVSRLRLFKLIAIILPVIILVAFEFLLRIFHYGHDTSLFIRHPDNTNYWVMNKYASQRYFNDTLNATTGSIEPFEVKKSANTVRIFVLGESTTAGYPYFHNGSFHRWLQYRLMHTYQNVNFEIINTSLTAVNSYTVLDFGKQVINFQPDAILIYTGHNEYYGALGVGSTSHIANNRFLIETVLTLRKLRLVQLFENIISGVRNLGTGNNINQRDNLMQRMAAQQEITYNSQNYKIGIDQYQANMGELCKLMQNNNIPVFLSTLVSNEKDQKPFISDNGPDNANQQFNSAVKSYQTANYVLAKQQYVKAKEFDKLRFRAPEAMNTIIKQLSRTYTNVHLVDAKKLFEEHSSHQILGNETLLEHVHPNLFGYALLSEAFYQSIKAQKLIKASPGKEISFPELIDQMPITKVDSLYGAYTITMLETGWPFNKPIPANYKRGNTNEEKIAGALAVNRISWAEAMNELFQTGMKENDKKSALKAVEAMILENPQNITYKIYAARLSFDQGNYDNSIYYFETAYKQDDSFENLQNLFLVYLKTDQPDKAIPLINKAINMQSQNTMLNKLLLNTQQIVELKTKLAAKPDDNNIKLQISAKYHFVDADEAANKYK